MALFISAGGKTLEKKGIKCTWEVCILGQPICKMTDSTGDTQIIGGGGVVLSALNPVMAEFHGW